MHNVSVQYELTVYDIIEREHVKEGNLTPQTDAFIYKGWIYPEGTSVRGKLGYGIDWDRPLQNILRQWQWY